MRIKRNRIYQLLCLKDWQPTLARYVRTIHFFVLNTHATLITAILERFRVWLYLPSPCTREIWKSCWPHSTVRVHRVLEQRNERTAFQGFQVPSEHWWDLLQEKSEASGILKLPLGVCFCCQVHNTLSRRLPTLVTFAVKHRTQAWMAHTWGHGSHTEGHMDLSARQGESLSHTYKLGGKLTKD